jgi:adenylate kinase
LVQRDDDLAETVRSRYRVYVEKTAPVIDYYSNSEAFFLDIDGSGEIDEVAEEIFRLLENV